MSLLQIFCLKLLKHRNQVYVQFYTDFPTRMENLIKTDKYGAQNGGYFELFNRIIVYGSFNYIFGTRSIQNFEIKESIQNWENANVICSWREINLNLTNTTVSALMTSPTTLSIKSNIVSSGRGTVSYLIIARI